MTFKLRCGTTFSDAKSLQLERLFVGGNPSSFVQGIRGKDVLFSKELWRFFSWN